VTWWTSDFDHWKKQHLFSEDRVVTIGPNFVLRLLHGCGYSTNVSPSRLLDHWQIARKFTAQADKLPPPDIILCSLPSLELAAASVRYGRKNGVPVAIDVRDLWPDIFVPLAPWVLRPLARLALTPYFQMARASLKGADAILAINDGFIQWGVDRASRERTSRDRAFSMAYPSQAPSLQEQERARTYWRQHGILGSPNEFNVVFAGTVGRQFEFDAVISAAKKLASSEIRFIICGTGDLLTSVESKARGLSNVLLPGWLGASEIWTLMRLGHIGLAPYHDEMSFTHSLPNKSLEYLAAGLPVISSLPGALERLLKEHDCGQTYPNNDSAALTASLWELRNNPDRRQTMARNAMDLHESKFRAEQVYTDMIEHLKMIAEAGSQRRRHSSNNSA
jgi:glycosyltransferase involved in cell wall biosynthesis